MNKRTVLNVGPPSSDLFYGHVTTMKHIIRGRIHVSAQKPASEYKANASYSRTQVLHEFISFNLISVETFSIKW